MNAEPFRDGCLERVARLIFDEVTEAYDGAERAARDAARAAAVVRDFAPYISHRREAALRALQRRNARGPNRRRGGRRRGMIRRGEAGRGWAG